LGAYLGRAIVTNGDFAAYVCYGAATRPSSQITLGRLVNYMRQTHMFTAVVQNKKKQNKSQKYKQRLNF